MLPIGFRGVLPCVQRGSATGARCLSAMSVAKRGLLPAFRAAAPTLATFDSRARLPFTGQSRCFSDKVQVKTPALGGESITEGMLGSWNFKVGDNVKKGDIVAVIETDKVTIDVEAEAAGQITEILVNAEDSCEVGQVLCVMGPPGAGAPAAAAPAPTPAATQASPAASHATAAPEAPKAAAPSAASPITPSEQEDGNRTVIREKMKRMRLAIARNLKETQSTMAMLTTMQEVDMSGLINMRKEYKDAFEETHGAKLGFQSPFFMACSRALMRYPRINAYIDAKTEEIVFRDFVDVGFAAATPKGLVTPVIRNVESMTLHQIEGEFARLAGMAKQDKLKLDDISNSTFTITNGGVFGSLLGTPLIGSLTTAGALGLHATKQTPGKLKDGSIGAIPLMYIALTYDHRLVDEGDAISFCCHVRDQVEDPRRMLLGL